MDRSGCRNRVDDILLENILHWILMLIAGLWVLRFLFRLACRLMPLIVAGYIIYTLFTK